MSETAAPISVPQEDIQRADKLKEEGNKHFAAKRFPHALTAYDAALALHPRNEVILCNRAFVHLKLESYGAAIADATAALEVNPAFAKAYYRRGSAFLALGKFKQGLGDFRRVATMCPGDQDAAAKLSACESAVKRLAFERAIATEDEKPLSETLDVNSIVVESDFAGPRMPESGITEQFMVDAMQHFRDCKLIHRRDAFRILLAAKPLLKALPNIQDVTVGKDEHVTVCGDIHGQYYDLLNIFRMNGNPSPSNPYVFNGDFVDRGSFSVEVILTLLGWKALYPNAVHLIRGNHETRNLNTMYGFAGEVRAKYSETLYKLFAEVFNCLPLATLINQKVLCVHGGLFSQDGVTLADIQKVDRFREPSDEGLMCEMLWSDPQQAPGRAASKRGVALQFGPDVTHRFLRDNNLELLVRSHEVKENGYEVEAGGKLITVFSAPNYCDQVGNKAAFIRFEADLKPKFTVFDAVPHPTVKPMQYAGSGMVNFL